MEKFTIGIIDDHKIVRQGLTELLTRILNCKITHEFESGNEFIAALPLKPSPDIYILDYSMPGMNGIEVLKRLEAQNEEYKVLMLTQHFDEEIINAAYHYGARGFLHKNCTAEDLKFAINNILKIGYNNVSEILKRLRNYEKSIDDSNQKDENDSSPFLFKIPKEMRMAVKQYFTYFPEYIRVTKGKNIYFEVKSNEHGVSIETDKTEDIEELNNYFNEYLGFVKSNIDDLVPTIEVEIQDLKKDLFILELKSQVQHFKQQIEFKNFQINYLENEVGSFHNILLAHHSNPAPIYINSVANSSSKSILKQDIEIIMQLKVELPKLQNNLLSVKENLPFEISHELKEEIELLEIESLSNEIKLDDIDKKPFKKIKRLFDQLTDEESELNKVVSRSKIFKESIQKLGKSYNKIAQWLALPNIPDILLEI